MANLLPLGFKLVVQLMISGLFAAGEGNFSRRGLVLAADDGQQTFQRPERQITTGTLQTICSNVWMVGKVFGFFENLESVPVIWQGLMSLIWQVLM